MDGETTPGSIRPQTTGEYRVGITFNPSGSDTVNALKRSAANLIDAIERINTLSESGTLISEAERCKALAMTAIEEGAMWAVKAATKPDRRR